jgi:uncharacterized protein YecE (DUF72 family)
LIDYRIGTGGWAYFKVPGLRSLVAYSRLFNFVEVNSTFYQIPNLKAVETWRRMVPPEFEFAVRCNKIVTHEQQFKSDEKTLEVFQNMITICKTLRAEILHLQTPATFEPNRVNANLVNSFLTSTNLKGVRLAYEARGFNQRLCPEFATMMQDYNMIHSIDLAKGEEPAYKSDILYSRLFGKGVQNIYQPTDQELKQIDDRAKAKPHNKVVVSFHFIRMYKDAARLKTYLETGKFPKVTRSTGFKSLEEVLKEDAQFPTTKQRLIEHQGWKLIDLTADERVRANGLLQKLPEKTYNNTSDIIQTIQKLNYSEKS